MLINRLFSRFDRNKVLFVFFNLCLWFPVLAASAEEFFDTPRSDLAFLLFFTVHAPFAIALYSNWLVLIPRLLARGRYWRYLFALLGVATAMSVVSGINPLFHSMIASGEVNWFVSVVNSALITFGIVLLMHLFTTPLFLSFGWFRQQNKIQELANANLQKEMAVLKAQFNPHFIFNSLNNIYSLAQARSELAPEMIMRLSKLLRYTSYQGRRDWVDLSEEIRFLEDYLELQKIRLRNKEAINLRTAIDYSYPVDIPPLLLILPIENAIKHGIETMGEQAYVRIELIQEDHWLRFSVSNNFDPGKLPNTVGIGLSHLRRRLELRYGNDHTLDIQERAGEFTLRMGIPLREADSEMLDLHADPILQPLAEIR